ncbi:unnamed protein product [Boreogadus saida]
MHSTSMERDLQNVIRAVGIDYDLCSATVESVDMAPGEDGKRAPLDWKNKPRDSAEMFKCISCLADTSAHARSPLSAPASAFRLVQEPGRIAAVMCQPCDSQ